MAAISTHTGQTGAPDEGRSRRPIQKQRTSSQTSGGYAADMAAKTCPRLNRSSDTDSETRTSRSRFRSDRGRRQSISPSRKMAQNESHTS